MKASKAFRTSGQSKATLFQPRVSHGISKPARTPLSPTKPSSNPTKQPRGFKNLTARISLFRLPIPACKPTPRFAPRPKASKVSLPRLLFFVGPPGLREEAKEPPLTSYHVGGRQQETAEVQEPQQPTKHPKPQDPLRPAEIYRAPGLRGGDSVWACPCFRPQRRSDSWGATDHLRRQDAIREGRPFQWPPMVAPELPPIPEDERCAYCRGWATPMDLDDPLEMQRPPPMVEYDDLMDID
jgi:hypothetical protein